MDTTKAQESRVRRLAAREGYLIRKSRRSLGQDNDGEFMLVEPPRNIPVLGNRYDADLQEIETYLRSES